MNKKKYLILLMIVIYYLVLTGCSHEKPKLLINDHDTIIYITNHDTKYHRYKCKYLDYSKIPITLEQAKERGLSPCPICKPAK